MRVNDTAIKHHNGYSQARCLDCGYLTKWYKDDPIFNIPLADEINVHRHYINGPADDPYFPITCTHTICLMGNEK